MPFKTTINPPGGWGATKPPLGVSLDYSHPLSQGLVACYTFPEGSGVQSYDLTGRCRPCTLTHINDADRPNLRFTREGLLTGSAIQLNGTYAYIGNSISQRATPQITIACIFTFDPSEHWFNGVDGTYGGTVYVKGVLFRVTVGYDNITNETTFAPLLRIGSSGQGIESIITGAWPRGKPTSVVLTSNGSRAYMYINGLASQNWSVSGAAATSTSTLYLGGGTPTGSLPLGGTVNDFRIAANYWTPEQVLLYHNQPYCNFEYDD